MEDHPGFGGRERVEGRVSARCLGHGGDPFLVRTRSAPSERHAVSKVRTIARQRSIGIGRRSRFGRRRVAVPRLRCPTASRSMPKSLSTLAVLGSLLSASVREHGRRPTDAAHRVRSEVQAFMARIPPDIARDGPLAWRRHPARAGLLHGDLRRAPPDERRARGAFRRRRAEDRGDDARGREIRIEPLAEDVAAVSAGYREQASFTAGGTERFAAGSPASRSRRATAGASNTRIGRTRRRGGPRR